MFDKVNYHLSLIGVMSLTTVHFVIVNASIFADFW